MAFDTKLADKIRQHLLAFPRAKITEKKMFGGIAFLVNEKMCINVSGQNLMCRFDPELHETILRKNGVEPMIMKGRELKGYCYVHPIGFKLKSDFEYWLSLCLDYNEKVRPAKTKKK